MNTHTRRALVALTGLSLVALGACSQGSATKTDDKNGGGSGASAVTVRYMGFSASGDHEKDLRAIADSFEKENPGIKVQIETTPYKDYFTKLQTSVSGGTAADAFELNYENFVTYTKNGSLAPLEGVDASRYKPALLKAFTNEGKQFGLPESFSNVVLFYNKTAFDKAGVPAPTASWTWKDEQAAAQKLTDKGTGMWGDYQPITFHEFYKALAQSGGTFLSEGGKKATFSSPQGVAAAKWLVEKSGKTMPTEAEGAGSPDFDSKLFKEGKLAMWHNGIWNFAGLKDATFEWDIVVEPGDTAKASAMFANGVAVNNASKNKEAAQKWISYLSTSESMVKTRLSTSWELPPIADESKLASYLTQGKPANRKAVMDSLNAVVLPPVIERQQEMQDAVTKELSNASAGRKSVEQALSDAQTAVQALLQ